MDVQLADGVPKRSAAEIFNSAVAATAVGAAWRIGALSELDDRGSLLINEFAARHELEPTATAAMFTALASAGVVLRDGDTVRTGPAFAEVNESTPMFYWLCQGSWELFSRMHTVLPQRNRVGEFYRRDAPAVSYASREANARFFDPVFWRAMEQVGGDFGVVADLGSGSGGRLIQLLRHYPGTRGLGLDIAASTIEMSRQEADKAGVGDRISFQRADVRDLAPDPAFAEVGLLTCFMMGHDLWPRENCVRSMRRLRELFPNVRRFLLGDTVRTTGIPAHEMPVFTLGFEVGHDLMGTYLPTRREWTDVFAEGGWHCVRTHVSEALAGTVVFELE